MHEIHANARAYNDIFKHLVKDVADKSLPTGLMSNFSYSNQSDDLKAKQFADHLEEPLVADNRIYK